MLRTVVRETVINGPIDEVYAIAQDLERYPVLMKDVTAVVISHNLLEDCTGPAQFHLGNELGRRITVTKWEVNLEGTPVFWREVDILTPTAHRIDGFAIEGDLAIFDARWRFEAIDAQTTRATLHVDFDFGMPMMEANCGPIFEIKVGENSDMMLEGMQRHFEAIPETTGPIAEETEPVQPVESKTISADTPGGPEPTPAIAGEFCGNLIWSYIGYPCSSCGAYTLVQGEHRHFRCDTCGNTGTLPN